MRESLRLGTFSGIKIGVHWSIGLIAALLTLTLAGSILPEAVPGLVTFSYWAAAIATTTLFLGSIVAHELGHSLVAQRDGVKVGGITLFALGGVATLESEPRNPGSAARIALAGPAVSIAVGLGSLAAAAAIGPLGWPALAVASLQWLGLINLVLAAFNLLPALPLDGGRVLQAALWRRKGNRHRATISAARLGRVIGWSFIALGLWQFSLGTSGLWTAVIGLFVISSAKAEGARAKRELRREQMEARGGSAGWPFANWFIDLSGSPVTANPAAPNPGAPYSSPPPPTRNAPTWNAPDRSDPSVIDVESWEVDIRDTNAR